MLLRFENLTIDESAEQVIRAEALGDYVLPLTRSECLILASLVRAKPKPLTRADLEREVWGDNRPPGQSNVVQVMLSRIRRKLGDPGMIITHRGGGYGLRTQVPA